MSDFDTVLERLLTDPGFASALGADPAAALAGYQLSADEVELLRTQMSGAGTADTTGVEARANQSSGFGLLSPLTGMMGGLGDFGPVAGVADQAFGSGSAGSGFGDSPTATSGFGDRSADPVSGFGDRPAPPSGFGDRFDATSGFGPAEATSGFGQAPVPPATGHTGEAGGLGASISSLLQPGDAMLGPAPQQIEPPVPEGYQTRVDVDGDGQWDRHIVRGRSDGGVDILVDHDGDGRVDFIGRDDDADGLVESASYDTDGDGYFDQTQYDDNGDGWLDRTVEHQSHHEPPPSYEPPPAAGGGLIGSNLHLPDEFR
ncbi:Os1348 family NHLP clan protein [Solwaraspora sp. WMMB335]|uniref:Os1348 family NHLP clan protein n=1 Tax=Solwaraspora sp. WMMB335 TaxID=3404118 RepID=UPI003B96255E